MKRRVTFLISILLICIVIVCGGCTSGYQEKITVLEGKVAAQDKELTELKRQQELAQLEAKHQQELTNLKMEHQRELMEAQQTPPSCLSPYSPRPYQPPYRAERFIAYVYEGENFEEYVGSLSEASEVDYYWGSGGPLGLRDHFSVRWEGSVWFQAGNYRFHICADEGARLYIDGRLLIDRWLLSGFKTNFETELYLTQGWHIIQLEYFDKTGQSVIRLSWQNLTDDP